MNKYFEPAISAHNMLRENKDIVAAIINKFIGDNPPTPYKKAYALNYKTDKKANLLVDILELMPELSIGDKVEASAKVFVFAPYSTFLKMRCYGPTQVYINSVLAFSSSPHDENFRSEVQFSVDFSKYENEIVIITERTNIGCGFTIRNFMPQWEPTFFFSALPDEEDILGFVIRPLTGNKDGFLPKRKREDCQVRYLNNSPNFARWTYPMGVTLYGFVIASDILNSPSWKNYALSSLKQILDFDETALIDRETFKYSTLNTQLYWLDELDDCGSFGNFMLLGESISSHSSTKKIADRIAHFMRHEQQRESDGAFSRGNETMWIDDLYMSTPFLVRYWQFSGEDVYLDLAATQFIQFKERFWISELKLMSHIFDVQTSTANKIPWSRGQGWVLFSLSEILSAMPKTHEKFSTLYDFFNEMLEGVFAQIDESGLWHQVLDEPSTYLESSATAMFTCAILRGAKNGFLDERFGEKSADNVAISSAIKAWEGLTKLAIDAQGNVYGVCRGSGFSFSKSYYAELGWRFNDPHGIGIVAMAGAYVIEAEKLYLIHS